MKGGYLVIEKLKYGGYTQVYRYAYCLNNPLVYVDPDGEMAWFVPVIIGVVVVAETGE